MLKPTIEQIEAVENVALAMSALTEVWNENFNSIYDQLGKNVTENLLTVDFYEMTGSWFGFVYALKDLTNSNKPWVCGRCLTPVTFDDVSLGYWATCPEHDEDLNEWECVRAANV